MFMPDSEEEAPERPPDKVLRRPSCGVTNFEQAAAEAYVQYECGKTYDLVENSP
jgi:hypothetical protein